MQGLNDEIVMVLVLALAAVIGSLSEKLAGYALLIAIVFNATLALHSIWRGRRSRFEHPMREREEG